MRSLFRAKGFKRTPPVGHVSVLMPRYDREFVMTFQRHGYSAGKMAPDLNSIFFSQRRHVSQ